MRWNRFRANVIVSQYLQAIKVTNTSLGDWVVYLLQGGDLFVVVMSIRIAACQSDTDTDTATGMEPYEYVGDSESDDRLYIGAGIA